jgi:nitroreductase
MDTVGLYEGLCTTRAIRRYRDEPIPDDVLRDILFAATRAPSGSNRQAFRFIVLTDGPKAAEAKALLAQGARELWGNKQVDEGYEEKSRTESDSPKARMAAAMQHYVDNFENVPAVVLACLVRYRPANSMEGSSVYPSCQNILLAARALGYGGVLTGFHAFVENDLRSLLEIPDNVFVAATITLGKPMGSHGPVRRAPMGEVVFADSWGQSAPWAVDPDGTLFTSRMDL